MNDNQDISYMTPEEIAAKYGKKVGVFGAYNEINDKERIRPIKRNPDGTINILPKNVKIGGITFDGSEGNDTVEQIAKQMNCTIKSDDARANGGVIDAPKLGQIGESNKRVIDIFIEGHNKTIDSKHAGLRYNQGKLRYDLICPEQLKGLASVYTYDANKYAPQNWRKGQAWSTVLASLKRHIASFEQGEDIDPESQCLHMSHAMWNCGELISFGKFYPQGDDRLAAWQRIPRIGLDVDECLAGFVQGYCKRYNLPIPHCWNFDRLFSKRMAELKDDKAFWLDLEPLINPADLPFEPAAYITSRIIPNQWTQEWLDLHGFPIAPTITVGSGSEKAEHIEKLGLDWFCDDRFETFSALNKRGICCFLVDAKHNQRYDVGSKRIKSLVELKERW